MLTTSGRPSHPWINPNPSNKTAGRVLWYPIQAKTGLEWGTQPLLPVSCRTLDLSLHPQHAYGKLAARDEQLASPATKAGCPIQARFWLEWDTTALDAPFLSS